MQVILQFACEWYDINKVINVIHAREVIQVLWQPPSLGNVKLNVNGSCKINSGLICAGGLLRNANGTWICGFSANIGFGTILEAELWSLFRGLQMAWAKNIRSLEIESDSMTTVTLITKTCEQSHPLFCLIEDCKELIRRNWSCNISHIYREQNRAADLLANMGHELPLGIRHYGSAPDHLTRLFKEKTVPRAAFFFRLQALRSFSHFVDYLVCNSKRSHQQLQGTSKLISMASKRSWDGVIGVMKGTPNWGQRIRYRSNSGSFTTAFLNRIRIPSLGWVQCRSISILHPCILQATGEFCTLPTNELSDSDSCNDAIGHLEESHVDSDGDVTTKTIRRVYQTPVDFTKVNKNLLPTVVLIGRPNVGKSALFNRLIRRREALVYNTPDDHVTRDIREGIAKLGDLRFKVLDSAGLETAASSGSILDRTSGMTASVLARCQFAVFLIDVRAGLHPLDLEVGRWLRKHAPGINLVVAMNKSESLLDGSGSLMAAAAETYRLGFGDPIAISAETGLGMQDLYGSLKPKLEDYMLQVLNNEEGTEESNFREDGSSCELEESKLQLQLAIVGRPNVGKSTLLNTLLQEERVLVGPEAGLTRDSIRAQFEFQGRTIYLVDTAGWLQRTKMKKGPASLSIVQTRKSLMRAHVIALVLDAEEIANSRRSLKHDEVVIARQAVEEGRGLVVVVNKMDLLRGKQLYDKVMEAVPQEIQTIMPQVTGIPIVFISALEGRGHAAVMHQVIDTYEKWCSRLSTARLNRWLRKVMSRHSWKDQAAQPKVKYFTQVKARPPTFVAFVSGKKELSETDIRFLKRSLKEDFDLGGIPIRIMPRSIERKAVNGTSKSGQITNRPSERMFSDKRKVCPVE